MSSAEKWYILDDSGNPTGPFSTNALAEKVEEGKLTKEVMCWCDGRESWQSAEFIAELQAAFGVANAQTSASKRDDSKNEFSVFEKAIKELEEEEEKDEPEASFVDDDGTLYVWNSKLKKYEPQESKQYDQETMTFSGLDEEVTPSLQETLDKEEQPAEGGNKRKVMEEESHWSDPKKTTSVYVTGISQLNLTLTLSVTLGLPLDVTVEEIAVVFSKCGVLKEDEEEGVKIKIYKDKESGMAKGDGLITYLKRPSVELAISILSGTPFRDNMTQKMTIQEAKFEKKGNTRQSKNTKAKKKKKVHNREDKRLGWSGFDDHLALHQITVILKHMFQPSEFKGGELTESELKNDVEKECSKLGEVDRVVIYTEHPDGVVSVRFTSKEAADACIQLMNGRFFAGRQIQAAKWDGFTRYRVHHESKGNEEDGEEARLEKFARDLEKV
eukprot:g4022.t1